MIKQIFETGSQQVDNEDVVQTLLAEIVDIGNASCSCQNYRWLGEGGTYGIPQESCMSDIRPVIVVHRSF